LNEENNIFAATAAAVDAVFSCFSFFYIILFKIKMKMKMGTACVLE
jgi:hypothetical protein